ncbi:hypothetical protein [Cohnella rhizosphaerae]|uniref:Uncharacterized protein n=1 Tax=Cohnella rhizosphaerae TaxID=1457232 RepID=A0A9X4KRL2_9BACL|nr:hypothetical protein [Cohnella rhizosphaerae]MDG0809273.1 hypothetical protein [Cohnella rhizosphaerae]
MEKKPVGDGQDRLDVPIRQFGAFVSEHIQQRSVDRSDMLVFGGHRKVTARGVIELCVQFH